MGANCQLCHALDCAIFVGRMGIYTIFVAKVFALVGAVLGRIDSQDVPGVLVAKVARKNSRYSLLTHHLGHKPTWKKVF